MGFVSSSKGKKFKSLQKKKSDVDRIIKTAFSSNNGFLPGLIYSAKPFPEKNK